MAEIIVIFTKHKGSGICNSDALLKIIELVEPEVVFEELSIENFKKVYEEGSLSTLESDAVKEYIKNHNIEHLPVDTYDLPPDYFSNLDLLYDKLYKGIGENSFHFRNLIKQKDDLAKRYGFQFLNSSEMLKYWDRFNHLKESILSEKNNDKLNAIAKLEKETLDKRDETMLDNIYNYCKENSFDKALFMVGSGHMQSIVSKIRERDNNEIHWHYYTDIN